MNRETLDGLALSQRQGFLGFGKLFRHEMHSFIYNIYYYYVLVLVLYGRSKLIIVHFIYHVYYRHVTTAANKQISLLKIDSPQIFKILSWEIACFSNSACAKEQFNHRRLEVYFYAFHDHKNSRRWRSESCTLTSYCVTFPLIPHQNSNTRSLMSISTI